MRIVLLPLLISACLQSSPLAAQLPSAAEFRRQALAALGGEVERLAFTAAGSEACMGQPWNINEGWARWELQDYRRVIDYAAVESYQTAQRRPGLNPQKLGGCGAQPDTAAAPQQSSVSATSPWSQQLQIWMTPTGFLQLAARQEATAEVTGERQLEVSIASGGVNYRMVGTFSDELLLEHLITWTDDPVFGDMAVEAEFADYRKFGAALFPASIIHKQGGYAVLDLMVTGVDAGTMASARAPERPAGGAARAPAAAETPAFTRIGPGVFVIEGSYQAVAVEFADFSVVIDGMQSDARTRDVIRLTKDAIPGKPIRYVVNTHAHFDHANGLREFIAEGSTILTHRMNVAFYEKALNTARTLNAGATPTVGLPVKIEGVDDTHEIRDDAGQVLQLFRLEGSVHAADMLIAYLPAISTVVESDVLQPWISPAFRGDGTRAHPYLVHLASELDRLGLDYQQFVPVHRPTPAPLMFRADLQEAIK